jgi:PEGA domain
VIALAPLATMGSEDTSAAARANAAALEKALAALPSSRVISAATVATSIKRAKRPALLACDGEHACILELGQLTSAQVVVTSQSGGLGDARVLYLRAVDVASGKELGSTTWTTGEGDSAAAAVARLLAPSTYSGRLGLSTSVKNATVYVNGKKLGTTATESYLLPVGTHALRVTHPELRDFVRFVDIRYGATTQVIVALQPLPVVQRDLALHGGSSAGADATSSSSSRPWYRRWWAIAGGAVVLGVVAGTVTYAVSDGFDPDVTVP